jgi:GNAT superfamily N-acetyltransferase
MGERPTTRSGGAQRGSDPIVRAATLRDAPQVLEVLLAAFERWPLFDLDVSPLGHLMWKLETATGDPGQQHLVATVDGTVAGVLLAWPGQAKVGSRLLASYNPVDVAVAPRYRGRNIGKLLIEASLAREPATDELGLDTATTEPALQHVWPMTGPRIPMRVWSRRLTPTAGLGDLLARRRWRAVLGAPLRMASRRSNGPTEGASAVTVLDQFDQRADELWAEASSEFDVIRRRDVSTLNWRYLDQRAGRMEILAVEEQAALIGFLAYRAPDHRGVSKILDLLVRTGRLDAAASLLGEASRRASERGATSIQLWLPRGHSYEPVLEPGGFFAGSRDVPVEVDVDYLRQTPSIADIFDDPTTTIHLTLGDFDWA